MTVTPITAARKSRDITVAYLGELLFNAGFIDESQRAEVDTVDRQFRAHVRSSKLRADDEASPFKAIVAMNLTDASGSGTRIDDYLLARLIAEDAGLHFFKIDTLKLDVAMVESKISRPFARKHRMVPVAVRDGKLIVSVVNPFDTVAIDSYQQMVKQDIHVVVSADSDVMGVINEQYGFRASVTKAERDLRGDGVEIEPLEAKEAMRRLLLVTVVPPHPRLWSHALAVVARLAHGPVYRLAWTPNAENAKRVIAWSAAV